MGITVQDNRDRQRFEIEVDGQLAGFADYRRSAGRIAFPHTEIRPAYGGRGLGTTLARAALDAVLDDGLAVQPLCWFVRDVIAAHPDEYLALVAPEDRQIFGLPAEVATPTM
jgi:predicted GNAT family acetyltransferase